MILIVIVVILYYYFFRQNKECYDENKCKVEWEEWDKCSKECGGGTQEREKEMKVALIGGSACVRLVERRDCNTQPC